MLVRLVNIGYHYCTCLYYAYVYRSPRIVKLYVVIIILKHITFVICVKVLVLDNLPNTHTDQTQHNETTFTFFISISTTPRCLLFQQNGIRASGKSDQKIKGQTSAGQD